MLLLGHCQENFGSLLLLIAKREFRLRDGRSDINSLCDIWSMRDRNSTRLRDHAFVLHDRRTISVAVIVLSATTVIG